MIVHVVINSGEVLGIYFLKQHALDHLHNRSVDDMENLDNTDSLVVEEHEIEDSPKEKRYTNDYAEQEAGAYFSDSDDAEEFLVALSDNT